MHAKLITLLAVLVFPVGSLLAVEQDECVCRAAKTPIVELADLEYGQCVADSDQLSRRLFYEGAHTVVAYP